MVRSYSEFLKRVISNVLKFRYENKDYEFKMEDLFGQVDTLQWKYR